MALAKRPNIDVWIGYLIREHPHPVFEKDVEEHFLIDVEVWIVLTV